MAETYSHVEGERDFYRSERNKLRTENEKLVLQAKRFEGQRNEECDRANKLEWANNKLVAEVKEKTEALGFYGNGKNWERTVHVVNCYWTKVERDSGKIARTAINKYKPVKTEGSDEVS